MTQIHFRLEFQPNEGRKKDNGYEVIVNLENVNQY